MKREYTRTPDGKFTRRIKPCPFCGSEITLDRVGGDTYFVCENDVCCRTSNLFVSCPTVLEDAAIKQWNKRV